MLVISGSVFVISSNKVDFLTLFTRDTELYDMVVSVAAEYFWGLTLDASNPCITWDYDLNDFDEDCIHTLFLKQALLGDGSKANEVNVVEIETAGYESDLKFPIAVLREATQCQLKLNLAFTHPPITFKLSKGSGPVHLLGKHLVECDDDVDQEKETLEVELELAKAGINLDEEEESPGIERGKSNGSSAVKENIQKLVQS